MPRRRALRTVGGIAAAALLVTALATACSGGPTPPTVSSAPPSATRPNIVFVLTDDLSDNLLAYMPNVRALMQRGLSFTNYTVADSLCCPSRASIFTGNFPHTTGIFVNHGAHGGFNEFNFRHEEGDTFAPVLQARGYRTAMMGKYLNEYYAAYPAPGELGEWTPPEATYIPPGWDEWDAVGIGYPQYNYRLNHDHHVIAHGHRAKDYLNTVLQNYGTRFISDTAKQNRPFFLEIASFSPHTPSTPAPQDVGTYDDLTVPKTPAFNRLPLNPPSWLASREPLTLPEITALDVGYQKRVESVQSVDRMVGALEQRLQASGQADNTIFVFSSDNGYHMGEHRLLAGKLTAYDTDVNVPLIVAGPGIAPGSTNNDITQNVDLTPTFEQLAGATTPPSVEGRSLVPLLHGEDPAWRTLALVEHEGPDTASDDPDRQTLAEGNPPSYQALRSATFTYVRYENGDREYYDRLDDPDELANLAPTLSPARTARLNEWLDALRHCGDGSQCWQAGRPAGV